MIARISAALALVLVLSACGPVFIRAPVRPGFGALYTNHKAPLQVDFNETTLGSKRGTASVQYLFIPLLSGLLTFAWGDASADAAAADGRITTLTHTDYELLSVLGIYMRFTTIAYGD